MSGLATLDPAPAAPAPRHRLRLLGALVGVLAVAVVGVVLARGGQPAVPAAAPVPVDWARPAVPAAGLAQRSGVTITQVAVTAGGGLVDLRFRVVDPDLAHAVHDPGTPPALVDEGTGAVLNRLLMNHAHSGDYRPAVTYYLVFENPGNWVHRGSRVTVLLGNAQVEHVTVG